MWVLDLKGNARTSGERRQREAGNVFDDKIRVGVAVYFLVRRKGADGFRIFYHAIDDFMRSHPKVDYVKNASLTRLDFDEIQPDVAGNWLNQSNSNFDRLMPLADRQTKLAKSSSEERAVFGLHSLGIATNRDEWTYDFDINVLSNKVRLFCTTYQKEAHRFVREKPATASIGDWVDRSIKWTSELEAHLVKGDALEFDHANVTSALYRPFVTKRCYYAPTVTHRRYQIPQMFPHQADKHNKLICFCVNGKSFCTLASDKVVDLHFAGDTQCLSLYRYTEEGERVSNITDWGIERINGHYQREWGDDFETLAGPEGITAEQIFAYTYAVLHDPVYRHDYAVDLLREFPRLPLYPDFHNWADMGQQLLDLHIGFESAEPFALERVEKDGDSGKAALKADKTRGAIILDGKTMLTGVPEEAWEYRLGSRSALEWVLDQYKERKPRDPTIREQFNTYRFADYKEQVIDLLQRVCTVSVKTVRIVDQLNLLSDIHQT